MHGYGAIAQADIAAVAVAVHSLAERIAQPAFGLFLLSKGRRAGPSLKAAFLCGDHGHTWPNYFLLPPVELLWRYVICKVRMSDEENLVVAIFLKFIQLQN